MKYLLEKDDEAGDVVCFALMARIQESLYYAVIPPENKCVFK